MSLGPEKTAPTGRSALPCCTVRESAQAEPQRGMTYIPQERHGKQPMKKHQTTQFSGYNELLTVSDGLTFSPNMCNFKILPDGSLKKREGYSELFTATGSVEGLWGGTIAGHNILAASIGGDLWIYDLDLSMSYNAGEIGTGHASMFPFGGKLYSEDGKASVLSTDPKTKEAVQFMYDLCNTYKVCPTATQAAQFGDNEFAPFMANKVAMQIGALSTASNMDANGTEYTVLPMPSIDGVSKTSSFVNTWVIPKTAKNPDLSWRVVEFLSGKEGQQIALDMNFGLPASKLVDTTAFEAKAPYNKYFVEALETAVPYPTNLNGSAFQTMFQKECESLWAGAITPEEFETRVDEQAAEILNK